jgi:hypothetical protein
MGSSVHDDIDDRRIPAMPCSDSQPTRNVSVAGVVAGGAGRNYANYPEALLHGLQKRHGGRHTASGRWPTLVEYPKAVVREAGLRNQSPNGAFIDVVAGHK